MAKKPTQETFDVFKQKRIPSIEKYADQFDEKRGLIAGLTGEMNTAKMKLAETVHENADKLDKQQDEHGNDMLVYVYGDYRVIVKTKEEIGVKIAEKSKGVAPEGGEPGTGE